MCAGNLVKGDEHHRFVACVLGAVPDVRRDEGQITRRNLHFLIVDDLFAFALKVIFDRVAVGVESAVDTAPAYLPLENPECVYVETQFRGDDPGQQMAFLLRGMYSGRRLPLDVFSLDQQPVLSPPAVKFFINAREVAQDLVPPSGEFRRV